jgi:YkoY family integral membrane protein
MYGQTYEPHDIAIVGLLIVLEGVLSIDNALVLGILAKRLPKHLQSRALTYGLVGAFVFRVIAIATASFLLSWTIAKLLGGLYLIYISIKHFFLEGDKKDEHIAVDAAGQPVMVDDATGKPVSEAKALQEANAPAALSHVAPSASAKGGAKFWPTVLVIELTDIAFAIDSILAAIAMVSTVPKPQGQRWHPKLWVVVTGGMLGVILMRFAAVLFIRLLEKFPRFEVSAYLLVIVIGLKLIADWMFNTVEHHHLHFHNPKSPEFWVFWVLMVVCFCIGFVPKHKHEGTPAEAGAKAQ